jgi:tetratricopeptide (TPR) repeat protein
MAAELAEWAITRKISRAIVYGLGKRAFGWRPEEIEKVQSPECLSIAADDYAMVLEPARRRMAEMLGIEATSPSLTQPAELSFMALKDRRLSSDLIDAQQAARRAQRMPLVNPAPILRRVSTIEMQRRNWDSALDWARQAIAADPIDASNHLHLASVLVQCGDLEGAERAVAEAIVQDPKATVRGYRLNSVIASNRKDVATSLEWARKSVDADLADDGSHLYLAGVLLRTNEFDEAEQAVERAIALRPAVAPKAYRQHSMIAQSRKDLPKAIYWIQRSIEIDPMESSYHNHLSGLLMQQGDLDGAEEAAFEALRLGTGDVSSIRRQIDSIATRKLALQTAS